MGSLKASGLFEKRRKEQKLRSKGGCVAVPIAPACEQHERNRRVTNAALERHAQRQRAMVLKNQRTSREMQHVQNRRQDCGLKEVAHMWAMQDTVECSTGGVCDDTAAVIDSHAKRKLPSVRARHSATTSSECTHLVCHESFSDSIDTPLVVQRALVDLHSIKWHPEAPSLADIDDPNRPDITGDHFVGCVTSKCDTVVLCAPYTDGKLHSWNELACKGDCEEWNWWLSPANWAHFAEDIYSNQYPLGLAGKGTYNKICHPHKLTPVDNPKLWPPQLKEFSMGWSPKTHMEACPYVMRVTTPPQDSMEAISSRESVLRDVAFSLQMAALGIGPQIYAVVVFPLWNKLDDEDDHPGCDPLLYTDHDTHQHNFGTLMIMERGSSNVIEYIAGLHCSLTPRRGPECSRPPEYAVKAHKLAMDVMSICYNLAVCGFCHYDMKQANMLIMKHSNTVRAIDFDSSFFVDLNRDHAGRKACFFVNLLLISVQLRAYERAEFVDMFARTVGKVLLELWEELVRHPERFGAGLWLKHVTIAHNAAEGTFDYDGILAAGNNSHKGSLLLRQMIWEYLHNPKANTKPPEKVRLWKRWKMKPEHGCFARLVPQLLHFALFFSDEKAIPAQYRLILKY